MKSSTATFLTILIIVGTILYTGKDTLHLEIPSFSNIKLPTLTSPKIPPLSITNFSFNKVLNTTPTQEPIEPEPEPAPTGGRSGSSTIQTQITEFKICSDTEMICAEIDGIQESNNITVYWQVDHGVGCCASYNCNYELFSKACLNPFRLYNIYLDNIKEEISSDYEYTCSYNTPWNYWTFYNVTPGEHIILIEQKDCVKIVDTETLWFKITQMDTNTYRLETS